MRRWGVWYGRWWMLQYALDFTLSLGIHIDPIYRRGDNSAYGPYVDIHLLVAAISLGNNPGAANNNSLMRPLFYADSH